MKNRSRFAWPGLVALLVSCVAPVSGWDVNRLLAAEPQVAAIEGQRIGDMTPHPALVDGRLLLVSCRYGGDRPVAVYARGAGWRADWGERAIAAVDRAVSGVELESMSVAEPPDDAAPRIEIDSVDDPDAASPYGLGDTLTACDVSGTGDPRAPVRGRIRRSEIRIRSTRRDNAGRLRVPSEAEWTGALMHELGHSLGFAGHAAVGDSLVLLEESRLRALGRRAARGEPVPAPNLNALYRITPGRLLGEVEVDEASRSWVDSIEALVELRESALGPATGPLASAGDREARLVWSWPEGARVVLRFPFWRQEIREQRAITALPSAATRRLLTPSERDRF